MVVVGEHWPSDELNRQHADELVRASLPAQLLAAAVHLAPRAAAAEHSHPLTWPAGPRRVRAQPAIIRSGQHWASASGDQLQDYENALPPKLMKGMDHLRSEADREGVLSLRVMTNRDPETCVRSGRPRCSAIQLARTARTARRIAGVPRGDLHPRHRKQREYGNDRAVVTWHEVFITTRNANFDVNCHEQTGIMPFAQNLMSVDYRS